MKSRFFVFINDEFISIGHDAYGTVKHWNRDEWRDDPDIVVDIADSIRSALMTPDRFANRLGLKEE